MRRAFPRQLYRRRALVESIFSSVKRKLSARAPGRSLRMQRRQALLLGLSFNLYRLKHRYLFLRMSTEPTLFYIALRELLCFANGAETVTEEHRFALGFTCQSKALISKVSRNQNGSPAGPYGHRATIEHCLSPIDNAQNVQQSDE